MFPNLILQYYLYLVSACEKLSKRVTPCTVYFQLAMCIVLRNVAVLSHPWYLWAMWASLWSVGGLYREVNSDIDFIDLNLFL